MRNRLLATFSSLLIAQVVAAGLGYLFWVVVARGLLPDRVAFGYAAVATMQLIGAVSVLGYSTHLADHLQGLPAERRAPTVQASRIVVGIAAACLAIGWLIVGPHVTSVAVDVLDDPWNAGLFLVGSIATGISVLTDGTQLGLGRPAEQVWRNVVASVGKFPLALVMVLMHADVPVILLSWVLPTVGSLIVAHRRMGLVHVSAPWATLGGHLREHARPALANHALNLSLGGPSLLLPILAAVLLSPAVYAVFGLVWVMTGFLLMVPFLLAVSLFATSVGDEGAFIDQVRRTLPVSLAVVAAVILAVNALAPQIMAIFGTHYAGGVPLLRLTVLAAALLVVKDYFFAWHRVRRTYRIAVWFAVSGLALEIGGAAAGGQLGGGRGLVVGWLLGLAVQVGAMLPTLARLWTHRAGEFSHHHRERGD